MKTDGRIAVAGATGRVGRHVVDVLEEQGHDVVPISRSAGVDVEFPRFRGHLSAWSPVSGQAGRMRHHATGIELQEAVPAGVPA